MACLNCCHQDAPRNWFHQFLHYEKDFPPTIVETIDCLGFAFFETFSTSSFISKLTSTEGSSTTGEFFVDFGLDFSSWFSSFCFGTPNGENLFPGLRFLSSAVAAPPSFPLSSGAVRVDSLASFPTTLGGSGGKSVTTEVSNSVAFTFSIGACSSFAIDHFTRCEPNFLLVLAQSLKNFFVFSIFSLKNFLLLPFARYSAAHYQLRLM